MDTKLKSPWIILYMIENLFFLFYLYPEMTHFYFLSLNKGCTKKEGLFAPLLRRDFSRDLLQDQNN